MKVCTYVRAGSERLGFIAGTELIDALDAAGGNAPDFAGMLAFIRSGDAGRRAAEALIA